MSVDPEPVYPENPAIPAAEDHPDLVGPCSGGDGLFGVYLALYAGSWAECLRAGVHGREVLGGVTPGDPLRDALIATAVVLAFVYMALCRRISDRHASEIRSR
jgi:hypothetical protein